MGNNLDWPGDPARCGSVTTLDGRSDGSEVLVGFDPDYLWNDRRADRILDWDCDSAPSPSLKSKSAQIFS